MGNCQIDACNNSKGSQNRDELFSLLSVCVKILKDQIFLFTNAKTSKNFLILETSYIFLNNVFQILSQGPKLSNDTHAKIKLKLSGLAGFLMTQKDNPNENGDSLLEEKNLMILQTNINEIQDVMKLKEFNDNDFHCFDDLMNELETFVKQNGKISDDVLMLYSEKIWLENVGDIDQVEWVDFYESFKHELKKTIKEDLTENILLMLRANLDSDNNLKVDRNGWNDFYAKIYSDASELRNFIKGSMMSSVYLKNSLFLCYISTPEDLKMKDFYFKTPTTFEISDEGIVSPKEFKVKKRINDKPLIFGRDNNGVEADVLFHKNLKEINKTHFQIVAKYILDPYTSSFFQTEFYLNNLSTDNPISFIVEEKGYILSQNTIIFLKNDVKILIKKLSPPPYSKFDEKKYFSIDSNIENRKTMKKLTNTLENPSIVLQVTSGNEKKEKIFNVYNDSSDFQITIGNAFSNDFTIAKAEPEHCSIHYDARARVWYIDDQMKKEDCYRTFIRPFEKGVKLGDKMKFSVNEHIFEVKDFS